MRIVLLKDIRGLGRKGELKDVKEGYARNFLLPQNAATLATPEALKRMETQKAAEAAEHTARRAEAIRFTEHLAAENIEFPLKAGEKGEAYGSITAREIEGELLRRGYAHARVILPHPVKELGSFTAEIDFGEGIKTAHVMRAVRDTRT